MPLREKIVAILRDRGPLASPTLRDCLINDGVRNLGSNRSIGQIAVSTPGIISAGKVRLARGAGDGTAEYELYELVDEAAFITWKGGNA